MPSQPLGTLRGAVPTRYLHFLQMWEFLEDAGGLQDGDFVVVQAPGVGGREKSSGDGCEGPGTNQTLSQTPAPAMLQLQEGKRDGREEALTARPWTVGCARGSW